MYPGIMSKRIVTATEFRTRCLALLDDVEERGETITIVRRGKPVATFGPVTRPAGPLEGIWADKRRELELMVEKDTAGLWNVDRKPRNGR